MKNLKNIDRVFQESLKDFEKDPPKVVWKNIDRLLPTTQPKKVIPLWLRVGNVAAIIILLFFVGKSSFDSTTNSENDDLQVNSTKVNSILQPATEIKEQNTNTVITETATEVEEAKIQEKIIIASSNEIEEPVTNQIEQTINSAQTKGKTQTNLVAESGKIALTDAINKEDEVKKIEKEKKKWSVATSVAPIYFSSLNASGSPIDEQLNNSSINGSSNFSYGLKVAYQFNDKLSVQSGVSLINLGYKTNDIDINSNYKFVGLANIKYNTGLLDPTAALSKGSSIPAQAKPDANASSETSEFGSLNQNFGYVEIPLEVKYNLKDGKFGVNLVGGFSTMLLNKNEVFLQTQEYTTNIGKASNLRDVNFSGNIGLDVDYLINNKLFINISPMLKVQTHTFSRESGGFQPYFLGVYTGLNYKF